MLSDERGYDSNSKHTSSSATSVSANRFSLVGRVFANGPGDLGLIPGRLIPKTLKMVLDTSLLNTQHCNVRHRRKWSNPGKGVVPISTPWCSSYWKGSLLVTRNYGRQLYLLTFAEIIQEYSNYKWRFLFFVFNPIKFNYKKIKLPYIKLPWSDIRRMYKKLNWQCRNINA